MAARNSLNTREKVTFLLSLVSYLQKNGRTKVATIAGHFGVSEKTVRDTVRFLPTTGIPGEFGVYLHGDLFDINYDAFDEDDEAELIWSVGVDDTARFSPAETAAILAGLQVLGAALPDDGRAVIRRLQEKLKGTTADQGSAISGELVSSFSGSVQALAKAIRDRRQVSFVYESRVGERMSRRVDPYTLSQFGSYWYLRGYCHLRQDQRTFIVESISELCESGESFEIPKGTEFDGSFAVDGEVSVVIAVNQDTAYVLDSWRPKRLGVLADSRIKMRVKLAHESLITKLVTQAPGSIEVIAPAHLRERVYDWADDLADRIA